METVDSLQASMITVPFVFSSVNVPWGSSRRVSVTCWCSCGPMAETTSQAETAVAAASRARQARRWRMGFLRSLTAVTNTAARKFVYRMHLMDAIGDQKVGASALALPVVLTLTAARLALHLALSGRYGYFRDE